MEMLLLFFLQKSVELEMPRKFSYEDSFEFHKYALKKCLIDNLCNYVCVAIIKYVFNSRSSTTSLYWMLEPKDFKYCNNKWGWKSRADRYLWPMLNGFGSMYILWFRLVFTFCCYFLFVCLFIYLTGGCSNRLRLTSFHLRSNVCVEYFTYTRSHTQIQP